LILRRLRPCLRWRQTNFEFQRLRTVARQNCEQKTKKAKNKQRSFCEKKLRYTTLISRRTSLKNLTGCVEILVELTLENFATNLSDEPKNWTICVEILVELTLENFATNLSDEPKN
jgi:hypothetical protein